MHALARLPRMLGTLAACGVAVLLFAFLLELAGYDSLAALRALWTGSFGTWHALSSATLVRATPLILTGLAVGLAFRAGIWNIGADGQLVMGAAAAAACALAAGDWMGRAAVPAALLAGALAGALWAAIAALLRHKAGVLEVISTIMLNFLALNAVSYIVRGPLQEPLRIYPQTASIAADARLPALFAGARVSWGLILAVASAFALWWWLTRTASGFRVRIAGANPDAARVAARIDVGRLTTRVFLASGAIAGLAGAIEVTGVTFALYENISPGYGYTAIAVALLARLNFLMVVASGLFFAALESGGLAMQRDAGVPSVVVYVVEGAVILATMLAARGWGVGLNWRQRGGPPPNNEDASRSPASRHQIPAVAVDSSP
ncbi:MAG: ABC transporter permease [Gemmatimonadaceae bacterium]|nr:ABC transporter permease [Gemmatimonadaceae bacterium]MDQ3517081.1 ABC transporter permease [Gemmatimonadota bacterium]